jgi:hypothetical protein
MPLQDTTGLHYRVLGWDMWIRWICVQVVKAEKRTLMDAALGLTCATGTDLTFSRPLVQDVTDAAGDARANAMLYRGIESRDSRCILLQ